MLYSTSQGISKLGSLLTHYALSLAVLDMTKSAGLFAFVLSMKFIPQILLYPIAGVIVDKVDRKKLLVFLDGIRGVLFCAILLITFMNKGIDLPLIYFIVIISAVSEVFYNPATNSIMPFLFDEENYVLANSFGSWIRSVSMLVGPALGTLLYSKFGIIIVLVLDMVSFFTVMGMTLLLKFKECDNYSVTKISLSEDIKMGIKLIADNKDLRLATMAVGCSRFFINPFYAVGMPFIMLKLLKAPKYTLGLAQTFIMAGALASPLLVMLLKNKCSEVAALMVSRMGKMIPYGILILIGISPFKRMISSNMFLLSGYFAMISFWGTLFNSAGFVFLNTHFQKRVPREYLGRFASIRFMIYAVIEPSGMILFGVLYSECALVIPLILVFLGSVLETMLLFRMKGLRGVEKRITTKMVISD